jgi:hypothetical protein
MRRLVEPVLILAVLVDIVLPAAAFLAPHLWFSVLHGVADQPDQHAFLWRCAAGWIAFAAVQIIALSRWKVDERWLAVVAGVRFSDVLTDWTYLASSHTTSLGTALLLVPGFLNLGMGALLLRAQDVK